MQDITWVMLGAFGTVVLFSTLILALDEIKRIYYSRGPEDKE